MAKNASKSLPAQLSQQQPNNSINTIPHSETNQLVWIIGVMIAVISILIILVIVIVGLLRYAGKKSNPKSKKTKKDRSNKNQLPPTLTSAETDLQSKDPPSDSVNLSTDFNPNMDTNNDSNDLKTSNIIECPQSTAGSLRSPKVPKSDIPMSGRNVKKSALANRIPSSAGDVRGPTQSGEANNQQQKSKKFNKSSRTESLGPMNFETARETHSPKPSQLNFDSLTTSAFSKGPKIKIKLHPAAAVPSSDMANKH